MAAESAEPDTELEKVCKRIGEFYATRHGRDGLYLFFQAQVTEIGLGDGGGFALIKCKRPGVLLGPRGSNVIGLGEFLGVHIKVVEVTEFPAWENAVVNGYYDGLEVGGDD